MRIMSRAAVVGALTMLAAGNAGATVLYTPPLASQLANEFMGCRLTNVSSAPRTVTIEARTYFGTVIYGGTVVVSPGATTGSGDTPSGVYCKFDVLNGGSKHVRASAVYFTSSGMVTTIVPAK